MILTRGAPAIILPSRWQNVPTGPLEVNPNSEFARDLAFGLVYGRPLTDFASVVGNRAAVYRGGLPGLSHNRVGGPQTYVVFNLLRGRGTSYNKSSLAWGGVLGAAPTTNSGLSAFGGFSSGGSAGENALSWHTTRRFSVSAPIPGGSSAIMTAGDVMPAGSKAHVGAIWDGSESVNENRVAIYQNGVYRTPATNGGTYATTSQMDAGRVGIFGSPVASATLLDGVTWYAYGWMARRLSADEWAELYRNPYQVARRRQRRIYSLMAAAATGPVGVIAPVITQATDNAGDVTGSLASGDSTDDTTPTIIGTAPAGSSVTVYRAGSISLGSAAADGAGDWSLTLTLPVGSHSLTAVAQMGVDLSEPSEPFLLTVVAAGAAPVITHYVDNVGALQGVFGSGTSTDDPVPVLYGTGVAGASLQVLRDGVASGAPVTAAGDGSWSFTPPGSLSAGTYTYRARQTVSGVTSADSAAFVLTVVAPSVAPDAPQILSYTDNFGPVVGVFLSGSSTDDTTPIFRGLGLPGALLRIMVDGTLRRTLTVPESGAWFGAVTFFEPGSYTVTATQTQAGLESDESADFLVTILPPGVGVGSVGVLQPAGDAAPQLGSLKVFEPVLIRSEDNAGNTAQAYLVSTNAITESVPAWTAGTYDQGALVAHIGTVWQSLIEGNTTTPGVDALTWSAVRPVSGTGAFDGSPSTITAAPGSLLELQIHSRRSCNILALLHIVCQSATIEIIRSSVTVYSETRAAWGRTLPNRGFLPDDMVFVNLDIQPGDDMRLTLNAEAGRVYVGAMLIGKYVSLGTLQRGATSGVRDSSRIVEDEFGGVALSRRKSAKRMSGQSVIDASEADFAHAVLDQYRATPVCWVGVDSMHRSLIVLGYCRNFEIRYTDPTKYTLDFDVEGFA